MRIDVLKRFGYYSTESNGHLSEYVPWYRKRLDEITKWSWRNRMLLRLCCNAVTIWGGLRGVISNAYYKKNYS